MAADESTNKLLELSNQMAADIFKAGDMLSKLPQDLLLGYAEKLYSAVLTGYSVDGSAKDTQMLNALKTNVYQFSAAKSYTQMKSLTEALLDADGNLRTWGQFRQAAFEINNEHVVTWLQAEYNNAIAASQMASKWQDIEANKAHSPYLQYVTAHDGRVRPAHEAMDGIVRLVDDPYWDLYLPPNGWNCRCTVKQISNGTVTPSEKLYHPTEQEVPKIFRFNAGKTQQVFSSSHPYFENVPKEVLQQAKIAEPEKTTVPNFIDDKTVFAKTTFDISNKEYQKALKVNDKQLWNLVGGIPSKDFNDLSLDAVFTSSKAISVEVESELYTVNRKIDFETKTIRNDYMRVYDKGNGLGTSLFLNQVKQARALGFKKLEVYAACGSSYDGYYRWARLGYTMEKEEAERFKSWILKKGRKETTVNELVASKEGFAFWKENGYSWRGSFNLNGNGKNMKLLKGYLNKKNIDFNP